MKRRALNKAHVRDYVRRMELDHQVFVWSTLVGNMWLWCLFQERVMGPKWRAAIDAIGTKP